MSGTRPGADEIGRPAARQILPSARRSPGDNCRVVRNWEKRAVHPYCCRLAHDISLPARAPHMVAGYEQCSHLPELSLTTTGQDVTRPLPLQARQRIAAEPGKDRPSWPHHHQPAIHTSLKRWQGASSPPIETVPFVDRSLLRQARCAAVRALPPARSVHDRVGCLLRRLRARIRRRRPAAGAGRIRRRARQLDPGCRAGRSGARRRFRRCPAVRIPRPERA